MIGQPVFHSFLPMEPIKDAGAAVGRGAVVNDEVSPLANIDLGPGDGSEREILVGGLKKKLLADENQVAGKAVP